MRINDLNKIYRHFGHENQVEKLREECREFLESGDSEEISDIFNVVVQLYLNDEKIRAIAGRKVTRTLERIEAGFYDAKD